MSYILDALRRAENERNRGAVPGLHSQATPATGRSGPVASAGSRVVLVTAAVLGAVLATGATWWLLERSASVPGAGGALPASSSPIALPASAPVGAVIQAAVSAATGDVPAPSVVTPEKPPVKRSPIVGSAAPRSTASSQAPASPIAHSAVPAAIRQNATAETERTRASEVARVAAPAPGAAATRPIGTVFAQADLPPAVREQLPNLQIAGVTYSANVAYRMAIVNGQVLHEGDQAAPGLRLESIEPERTIWSFRGYRYGMASR